VQAPVAQAWPVAQFDVALQAQGPSAPPHVGAASTAASPMGPASVDAAASCSGTCASVSSVQAPATHANPALHG
jgi:hypothetical protein